MSATCFRLTGRQAAVLFASMSISATGQGCRFLRKEVLFVDEHILLIHLQKITLVGRGEVGKSLLHTLNVARRSRLQEACGDDKEHRNNRR